MPRDEPSVTDKDTTSYRVTRRSANRATAAGRPEADAQGLIELACECMSADCERRVKVPLHVYQRMLGADQYLLRPGHHAFARYRTIVSIGLMRIEERA